MDSIDGMVSALYGLRGRSLYLHLCGVANDSVLDSNLIRSTTSISERENC